jgi:hypothetical protein
MLQKSIITHLNRDIPAFELQLSFRFLRTTDRRSEPNNLPGQINYEKKDFMNMNAEIYRVPVFYRDVACDVDNRFISENKYLIDKISDQDLPVRFQLENLL